MEKENRSKNFIKRFFIATLAVLLAIAGTVFFFDPFYHYHKPWCGLKAVLNDKEYQCVGTLRNFDYDALIFENIDFNSLILKNRSNGKGVKVTFKDFPYLLLWTRPNAPYICVEPWCGITDKEWCDQKIENKVGIETVRPNGILTRPHSVEIL